VVAFPSIAFFAADHVLTASKTDAAYDWYKRSSTGILGTLMAKPAKGFTKLMSLAEATCLYMGLFLAPIIIPFFTGVRKWITTRANILWFSMAAFFTTTSLCQMVGVARRLMPFSQNLFRVSSLGSMSIMGVNFPDITRGEKVWLTIVSTTLALAFMVLIMSALAGLVGDMARRIGEPSQQDKERDLSDRASQAGLFCTLCACLSVVLVVLQTWVTNLDRYYIVALAPCIVAAILAMKRLDLKPLLAIQVPLVIFIACYSLAAQQDYMGWNRARWTALRTLESEGVAPRDIDGGSEYFFANEPTRENLLYRGAFPQRNWRWWPITNETYIISFSPVPGYVQEDEAAYWSALSQSTRHVLVLRQIAGDSMLMLPQPKIH
jgi:hypothetical protein